MLNTDEVILSPQKDAEKHEIVAGARAMAKQKKLENNGAMKRLFNNYLKSRKCKKSKSFNKTEFIPFVDERDHLGNLIDSEIRTQLGGSSYIKRRVALNPRRTSVNFKSNNVEVRDDIPQRWTDPAEGKLAVMSETYSPEPAADAQSAEDTYPFNITKVSSNDN